MQRVTIIHRWRTKPSHMNSSNEPYEVEALHDLTDRQLEETLRQKNEGLKTSMWSVKADFHLAKTAEQKKYLQYCLDCYYDPYCYDQDSANNAGVMIRALRARYPYFK